MTRMVADKVISSCEDVFRGPHAFSPVVSESSGGFCLIDCGMEFAQLTDKIHQWVTSIRATRAGKQPYARVPERILLGADLCAWSTERHAVGTDTQDGNPAWAVDARCTGEPAPAGHKLRRCHLARCRCGPPHQACDAVP